MTSSENPLAVMLQMQENLQLQMPGGKSPRALIGEERAQFLVWNFFALEDELHEAIQETGWKPWATSRHLTGPAMLKEMVDAWHFFMNILLVIGEELGLNNYELAMEFMGAYVVKNAVNAQRQAEGYDGVSNKCKVCYRALDEVISRDGVCFMCDSQEQSLKELHRQRQNKQDGTKPEGLIG